MSQGANAKFKKGEKRLAGPGRPPGSINKKSLLVADALDSLNIDLVKWIISNAAKLPPKEQAEIGLALMPYRYPKLTSYEIRVGGVEANEQLKDVSDAVLEDMVK